MKLCHHWLVKDIICKNSELLCGIKENDQLNGCVHHQRSEFDQSDHSCLFAQDSQNI